MKAIFKIFPERRLVPAGFIGTIVYREILQWFDEVAAHPDFSREFQGLVDLRRGVFGAMPTSKMAEKARALAEYIN